jgi:hypothetical protein
MKRKLRLHRDTLRNLQLGEVTGGQLIGPTLNPQSCVYVCVIPTRVVSCGGTCVHSCFNVC